MRRLILLLALGAAGCASTGSYSMRLDDHTIDLAAGSFPIGWMHQFKAVCTAIDKSKPDCTVMDDQSAGQMATGMLTNGVLVGGATYGVTKGLEGSGSGITIP